MRWTIWLAFLLMPLTACGRAGPEDDALLKGAERECQDSADGQPDVQLDPDTHQVVRTDAQGNRMWTTILDGRLGGVRGPHLVWDNERVYFSREDGVTALDMATGKVLWRSAGPNNRLLLSKELLLATGSLPTDDGWARDCWLLARSVRDGSQVFKVEVPVKGFDPQAIEEFAGLFVVQSGEAPGGEGDAWLINRKGEVRHRFNRQVVTGKRVGDAAVFLTSTEVVSLSADDKVHWAIPFEQHQWIAGGGLVELADGDMLAFRYGRICDSGVQLIRFTASSGKAVWKASCGSLGVGHSQYSHRGAVAVEKENVRVTSCGSYGTFVELLDLRSGRQLKRAVRCDESK
jgi:outer membrane protein assembly factor BamB